MTPRSEHSYFLPRHGLVFDARWARRARRGNGWFRSLFGGAGPGRPEKTVDPEELAEAVRLVEEQDVESATTAFTELGYDVTVQAHSLR
jgi:hypothetical protein